MFIVAAMIHFKRSLLYTQHNTNASNRLITSRLFWHLHQEIMQNIDSTLAIIQQI